MEEMVDPLGFEPRNRRPLTDATKSTPKKNQASYLTEAKKPILKLNCLQKTLQPASSRPQLATQKQTPQPTPLVVVEKRGVYGNN